MDVRYGQPGDLDWLRANDRHVDAAWIARSLRYGEYLLAIGEHGTEGFLRFSQFWGSIPYMELIWVLPDYRRRGVGSALVGFWEEAMRKQGAKLLMTSSVKDELEAQAWHRRMGFRECGELTLTPHQGIPEVFFIKDLAR